MTIVLPFFLYPSFLTYQTFFFPKLSNWLQKTHIKLKLDIYVQMYTK